MLKRVLVRGPALSASGYGEQARFALRALKAHEERFDIFLQNIRWGNTGWIAADHPDRAWLDELLVKTEIYGSQGGTFDISLQVTIPNEFEKLAPVNIGYTAGIETTKISPQWVEKSSLVDKIIVVSNHSKYGFDNTQYTGKLQGSEQEVVVKNQTPVDVVNYCVRNDIPVTEVDLNLTTDFNFLAVAQWGPRKNLEATIVSFLEEFKDEEVGLVLKISTVRHNVRDRVACEYRLNKLLENYPDRKCKLYLLHGNMTESELFGVYNHPKIKAIVSTSHGEGFGLPLFEAAYNGLPVIAPNWSGQTDFLYAPKKDKKKNKIKNRPHFTKIDYDLNKVQPQAVWDGVIQPDASWCYVKKNSVKSSLREVYKNHGPALAQAKRLKQNLLKEFTPEKKYLEFADAVYVPDEKEDKWIEEVGEVSEV